jgi:hypothetical protein
MAHSAVGTVTAMAGATASLVNSPSTTGDCRRRILGSTFDIWDVGAMAVERN